MRVDRPQTRDDRPRQNLHLVLRLLDHQIVGPDQQLVGNVDDLELVASQDGGWRVTGIVLGPGALGQRLPGKLGSWTEAIWRRLHPEPDPQPIVLPLEAVSRIDSAVAVTQRAAEELASCFGLEEWLRTFVVSRIPGASGGAEQDQHSEPVSSADRRVVRSPLPDALMLSGLIGARARDRGGHALGVVSELAAKVPPRGGFAPLQVTHVHHTQHLAASQLGYLEDPDQGPWLVRTVVRRLKRGDRVAPVADVVSFDARGRTVVLDRTERHLHPHVGP
jgi:hypothetical protein